MRIVRICLGVLLLGVVSSCAFAQEPPKRKLIELGWDIPTTEYISKHWQEMEANAPFDGIIYNLVAENDEGAKVESQQLFTADPWKQEWFETCIQDLKSCKFQRYHNNFIRINFFPTPFDWTDEECWKNVCEKARICAWAARQTSGGLCFDFESYGAHMFKHDPSTGRSFDESKALARQRGAEMFGAICKEYPDVVVLCLFMNTVNFAAGRSENPDFILLDAYYGLLPSFIDGMLDVVDPATTLVEGCEDGYIMNGTAQYNRAACDILLASGPAHRLVSPENRQKYRTQVQAGFGFYLDMYANPEGHFYYRGPEPGETRFDRLMANLQAAWNAADEYVWVYGEQKSWWPPENVESDDDWESWEEALPGIRDFIFRLSNPKIAMQAFKERVVNDPNTVNLCVNGDFSDLAENGMPASWTTWQMETLPPGEFAARAGVAVLKGVRNGCFLQSIEGTPGESFLITGKMQTKGDCFGVVRARWQDSEGNWVNEELDVTIFPDYNKRDKKGYVEITGNVVVPEGARYLLLLLSASGIDSKGIVGFDDIKVYSYKKR